MQLRIIRFINQIQLLELRTLICITRVIDLVIYDQNGTYYLWHLQKFVRFTSQENHNQIKFLLMYECGRIVCILDSVSVRRRRFWKPDV